VRYLSIAALFACGVVWSGAAQAQSCSGLWGGSASTKVTFTGARTLRYCYQSKCWDEKFSGDKGSRLSFTVGGGARVTMTRKKNGNYSATWKAGSNRAAATYTCR
jgi:hypothetical protein